MGRKATNDEMSVTKPTPGRAICRPCRKGRPINPVSGVNRYTCEICGDAYTGRRVEFRDQPPKGQETIADESEPVDLD